MELKLPEKLKVIDVTLRDGLQNEERYMPLKAKIYIANKLIEAGFKSIEAGSLSHVEYVPQFRDVDDLLRALPRRDDVEYTVLALTKRACARAAALVAQGVKIDRVLTGQIATSEAYALKNMKRTHGQLFAEAEENVQILRKGGIPRIAGNIGTIFGCPIQGEVPIERAYEFMDRMFDMGFDEIEHSDPDGKANPAVIAQYFDAVLARYPDRTAHSFHIHDIRGAGMAGYLAAMLSGITVFDVSLGGIGGQVANMLDNVPVPGTGDYYLESRRTGLVCTEDFVTMANEMKIETGLDHNKLYALGMTMEKMLGRKLHAFTSSVKRIADKYSHIT